MKPFLNSVFKVIKTRDIFHVVLSRILIQKKHFYRLFASMGVYSILKPPCDVRGMTILNRDRFQTTVKVPSHIVPTDETNSVLKTLKPFLLKMPKLRPVCKQDNGTVRMLICPKKYETLTEPIKNNIEWSNVELKYENWTSDDIFRAVLPEDSVGNVSSFSTIGHIIHLNLKTELLDYKHLIGQVLLDKYQPTIKTVINKSDIIDNTYRNSKMEILVGEDNFKVLVKENNCKYALDYEKVFWNPRLGAEHERMKNKVSARDLICDVFAGVGPFAIPMAKKGCKVHANDLNPDSHHWLCHNAKLNKVNKSLQCYNMDGKDFIETVVQRDIIDNCNDEDEKITGVHILMNLPALALTFLKYFSGLLAGESVKLFKSPIIHCYYFRRKDEEDATVLSSYLQEDCLKGAEIVLVRLVAPNKYMMRVSFALTEDILFHDSSSSSEPEAKRIKLTGECDTPPQTFVTLDSSV